MTQKAEVEQAMAERGLGVQIRDTDKGRRATLWLRHPYCFHCGQPISWPDIVTVVKRPHARSYASRLRLACHDCGPLWKSLLALRQAQVAPGAKDLERRSRKLAWVESRLAERKK